MKPETKLLFALILAVILLLGLSCYGVWLAGERGYYKGQLEILKRPGTTLCPDAVPDVPRDWERER